VAVIKPSECGGQKFLGTGKNPGSILNLIDQLCLGLVIVILASPPKTLRPRQAGPEIMSMGSNFVLPVCIKFMKIRACGSRMFICVNLGKSSDHLKQGFNKKFFPPPASTAEALVLLCFIL
jgi:hypothetical protein